MANDSAPLNIFTPCVPASPASLILRLTIWLPVPPLTATPMFLLKMIPFCTGVVRTFSLEFDAGFSCLNCRTGKIQIQIKGIHKLKPCHNVFNLDAIVRLAQPLFWNTIPVSKF